MNLPTWSMLYGQYIEYNKYNETEKHNHNIIGDVIIHVIKCIASNNNNGYNSSSSIKSTIGLTSGLVSIHNSIHIYVRKNKNETLQLVAIVYALCIGI